MALPAIAGFFILAIVGGVGFGVASASSIDDVARSGAFGFNEATHSATLATQAPVPVQANEGAASFFERSALASSAPRDISAGMQMIDDMERAEQERIAADNAAALERMAAEKAKQGVETQESEISEAPAPETVEYSLPAVDWTVGGEAFVAEWAARIDAYLAGSPLEGYGSVFAEAAWENGVDPRWSPAISNTESSKGSVCFRSHNAWGWGNSSWSDWDTAIRAHVSGLASVYGYSITAAAAQTYCPPNWASWYNDTLGQMALI